MLKEDACIPEQDKAFQHNFGQDSKKVTLKISTQFFPTAFPASGVFLLKWLGYTLAGSQSLLNHSPRFFITFCHWLKHHSDLKKPPCIHRFRETNRNRFTFCFPTSSVMVLMLDFCVQIPNLSPFYIKLLGHHEKSSQ